MKTIYTYEDMPTSTVKSIFLAGPTPRDEQTLSWRPSALQLLEEMGFGGHVFMPEYRDGDSRGGSYEDQVAWETEALNRADVIVFWVPRDMKNMPALTTNVEFGHWCNSGKIVFGAPRNAEHVKYLFNMAKRLKVPSSETLLGVLGDALVMVGKGALRSGGEATVPLLVWNHPTFQAWYRSQKEAGNRLESANVEWTFRVGPKLDKTFFWIAHVNVWIAAENRVKSNEVVLGRPDVATVCLYYKPENKAPLDTEIVLIREFRSPGRTQTGFVTELPGGSSKTTKELVDIALEELAEETSVHIEASRLVRLAERQMVATLSAHTSTLFSVRITKEERDLIAKIAHSGKTFGLKEDTEKTYVELRTIREILKENLVDWANLGEIFASILPEIETDRQISK